MSSSVTSSSNSQQTGSSSSSSNNRFKNYPQQQQQQQQNKQRFTNNNSKQKNYASAAASQPPSTTGVSYANAAKGQNVLNQIENSSNLAKMDKMKTKNHLNEGIYRNSKFMTASNTIIGCPVILKVKSNDTFHGIFVTCSPEFDVLLECCHKIDPANEVVIFGRSLPKRSQVHARFFERDDIVEMTAYEVDKDFAQKSAENNFIDAAIAAKVQIKPSEESEQCKELEPFPFDDEENSVASSNNLENEQESSQPELELHSSNTGWNAEDMLMTNQQKYGYKSTYNSDLTEYTIAVEKEDTEDFRRREEAAEKLAAEIESSATYRRNIDKELSDNEEEEEAFSAVVRTEINNNSSINNNNVKETYKNDKFQNQRRSFNQNNKQMRPNQPQQKRPYNKIDRQSSTSSYPKRNQNDLNKDNKKYPQKFQNLTRQSSGTNTALFSAVVASNSSQDQSFSSQQSYSSKVSQSSKKEKSSPSPSQPAECVSSTSSSTSNTPNKSLNTSEPVVEPPREPTPVDTNRFKLNPDAVEFNPTFMAPNSQNSPSPGLMTNPIQIVVAPAPGQYNYDYQTAQIHPHFTPGQPPIIYQQPGLVTPQQQTTQILINNPAGSIPIPQFYVMNQPPANPPVSGGKVKKAVVSVNEGASIAISQRNPIYYGPNGQQIIPPTQPYVYPTTQPGQAYPYPPVRMMAPGAPQYYPVDQSQVPGQVYYPYPNQIVHPHIQHGYNQQFIVSPQMGQTQNQNTQGQQQQQQQQQPPPPSSTPSNVQNNHSAPHTPSPMPNINQATQQMQQMQISYTQGYPNFMAPTYPPNSASHPPPPPQTAPQGYSYQTAYQQGQQQPQFIYQQGVYQPQPQQQPQQQNYTYQNRMYYMSSNSSTNLQNSSNTGTSSQSNH